MANLNSIPTLWNKLAETMHLTSSPGAHMTLSESSSFSFARLQSSCGLPKTARPIVGEHGYIVALQLIALPFMEQFLGGEKVSSGFYPTGAVSAIDLQDEPSCFVPSAFDTLILYVTQAALDEISYDRKVPRVERLVWPHGAVDPVVHHLGQTLTSALAHSELTPTIFLDHIGQALNCHLTCVYGSARISTPRFRGGLSPRQRRTATELLDAHLDGNIVLQEIAEACQLSLAHFARAFKKTFHTPPHRWLSERRVERAKDLMTNSNVSLSDIAVRCGFADQSAFNRSFKRLQGISPGLWRRRRVGGRDASCNSNDDRDFGVQLTRIAAA